MSAKFEQSSDASVGVDSVRAPKEKAPRRIEKPFTSTKLTLLMSPYLRATDKNS